MVVRLIAATFGAASILVVASVAYADAEKEISTAATHAGLAQKAGDMKGVKMHLQHVTNCLVGPSGKGFDAAPGNPCNGQGNGAIADTTDAAQKQKLTQALDKVQAGLKQTDMAAAKKDAEDAQGILTPKM
ncbi:MAG TPA: hypothetical protein VL966_06300 [Alphaproteobacteria bacterium]|jgi:hypothetical protein|nr:hypothetical protein [Alphaproteobacteria bacterium]